MAKMPLAEHDNVVKTFPPDRTDTAQIVCGLRRLAAGGEEGSLVSLQEFN
jgi:hypothetical protein